ncbi:MAG: hypothetical protein NT027_20605 [Proteobacteria bacterium]|nr:hypothetical protein [Pseudomonadota bacterium]
MKASVLVGSILAMFALTGCGEGESTEQGKDKPKPNPTTGIGLVGNSYQSDCIADQNNTSQIEEIIFGETTFERNLLTYSGAKCEAALKSFQLIRKFSNSTSAESRDVLKWTELTYKVESIQASVHQQQTADLFKSNLVYGYSDWAMGAPKEVSGKKLTKDSDAEPALGSYLSSTYKIEGNKLFLAQYRGGKPTSEWPIIFAKK